MLIPAILMMSHPPRRAGSKPSQVMNRLSLNGILMANTTWRATQCGVDAARTNFDALVEVSDGATRYTDTTVRNGETYYYAVSAYDADGNESELSPEDASDTPRPEGRNVVLDDYNLFPIEADSILTTAKGKYPMGHTRNRCLFWF